MTAAEIEATFPSLGSLFDITSPTDEEYNCIAWSINDIRQWWWPTPSGQRKWPGKYWPPGVPHEETLDAFTRLYEILGFQICTDRTFEIGYDKIAIYADNIGTITHAARWWQEDNGWSSKLGEENDIRHHSLESIEGASYGAVLQIMKRLRLKREG
jgi:hypothetical protein